MRDVGRMTTEMVPSRVASRAVSRVKEASGVDKVGGGGD
jgi:hypothetical protein